MATGSTVQFRPQTILQASGQPGVVPTSVPGQVSLQGTLIQTSTGNRILIQPPVMAGQQINLANLQGLQIRPQIQHVQQGQAIIQQGQTIVQQGQGQTLVQQGQGQTLVQQGQSSTTQVIGQQGQVIQQSATNQVTQQTSQTTQVLQPQASQPTQILQQGALPAQPQILAQPPRAAATTQIVQQQTGVQPGQMIQPGLASTGTVQTQPQQPAIAPAGIQLQTPQTIQQQLPAGVSIVNINGQQILIQRAPTPGSQFQNIILKAVPGQVGQVPNVIQIQAPAPNQGQITASQPQVVLAPSATGQVPQQIQLPQAQGMGQPQVLGNVNVLNDSQNLNINVNILPAQGQNTASQALQQLQQNKVQLAGGQLIQPAPVQTPSTQTTPVKILPKGSPAPQAVGPAVQNLANFQSKPVIASASLSSVNSSLQQTVTVTQAPQQVIGSTSQPLVNTVTSLPQQQQPVLTNASVGQQDILSQAAALTDIPLQGASPLSQPTLQPQSLPTLSSGASPTALNTTSMHTQPQTSTVLTGQPALLQTMPGIKTEQKPVLQTIQQQQAQIQMLTAAKTEQKPQLSQLQQTQSLPVIKSESNIKSEPTASSSMPQVLSTQSLPNVSPQQQPQQTNLKLLANQSGGTVTNQKPQIIMAQPQQQNQVNLAPVGSASQGLQALAANNAAQLQQTQTVTIHHQPLQPKSTTSPSGVQHITIPAISQGSVVTTMATIRPNAPVLSTSPQGSKTTTGVLAAQRNQPAPNVNIANMPHLQTLPPSAAMLVQNPSSSASTPGSQVSTASSQAEGVAATGTTSTQAAVAPPIIPTVVPNTVQTASSASPSTQSASPQQGVNVGNHNLLQRIQQQIKVEFLSF